MNTTDAAEQMTESVYTFVQTYVAENGYPPSLREIGASVHLAASGVARHLDRLEAWGRLSRQPGRARGIALAHRKSEQKSEQMFTTN